MHLAHVHRLRAVAIFAIVGVHAMDYHYNQGMRPLIYSCKEA